MGRRALASWVGRGLRTVGLLGVGWVATACVQQDATQGPPPPPKTTMGADIYAVMCDRLGASVFAEDLTGDSYHAVCHPDDRGFYADRVDQRFLPPTDPGPSTEARRLAVAKIERLAKRRGDLIFAIDAAVPDDLIQDKSPGGHGQVRRHDAFFSLMQTMTLLYGEDPFNPGGPPLIPTFMERVADLLASLAKSGGATKSFSKISGRQGYRPSALSAGVLRPLFAYPDLGSLVNASLDLFGPGGAGAAALERLLTSGELELSTMKPGASALPVYTVDAATAQPNRPRTGLELASALLLAEDERFGAGPGAPPSFLVQRDQRGFALPAAGAAAPFADTDGDGLADLDAFGRFVDAKGAPLPIAPPFAIPGVVSGPVDAFGRPAKPLYAYLDTSRTVLASAARSLRSSLVEPGSTAGERAGARWESGSDTLFGAFAGASALFGGRAQAAYDFDADTIRPASARCDHCVAYLRFRGEDSPLADLAHGFGQLLADKDSDAILVGLMDLIEKHEDVVARLLDSALRLGEAAFDPDRLAELEGSAALSTITVRRGPKAGEVWTGSDVLHKLARLFTSQAVSATPVDGKGSRAPGAAKMTSEAVSPARLLASALRPREGRFAMSDAAARTAQWEQVRSTLADNLLGVEGSGQGARFKSRAVPGAALVLLDLLRQQVNAHCPDRETTGSCDWAKTGLRDEVASGLSGPMLAATVDVIEAIRANEPARREFTKLLGYLLSEQGDRAAFQSTLTSLHDIVLALKSGDILKPIFEAIDATPGLGKDLFGVAAAALKAAAALQLPRYDRYGISQSLLTTLVLPMSDGRTPIGVISDIIGDVDRIDSSQAPNPLSSADYSMVFQSLHDFIHDDRRGLEQLFHTMRNSGFDDHGGYGY